MQKEVKCKYFIAGIILLLLFISYKIISPYIITLVTAFILAYLVKPIYERLNKKIGKTTSAIVCICLIILLIIIPSIFVINNLATNIYSVVQNQNFQKIIDSINSQPLLNFLKIDIENIIQRITEYSLENLSSIISYIPFILVSILILIMGVYYILIDWKTLSQYLENFLPFKNKKDIIKDIKKKTNAIVYGSVLMAVIQAIITLIGFYLLGIPMTLILSVIIFFLGFLPSIGPAFVWVPTAIYYLLIKNYFIFGGILLIGIILSYGIDTLLRAKVLGKNSKINPLILLVGILGGITMFGIFGFIIGPLILVYTLELMKRYFKEN
jgi:predicted PurR-regulated permease PerM